MRARSRPEGWADQAECVREAVRGLVWLVRGKALVPWRCADVAARWVAAAGADLAIVPESSCTLSFERRHAPGRVEGRPRNEAALSLKSAYRTRDRAVSGVRFRAAGRLWRVARQRGIERR